TATGGISEALSCSVCLGLLEDPTTLPCGHSYCLSCTGTYWSKGNQRRTPKKNIILVELVEQKKTSNGKKQQFGPSASQKDKQKICPHHNEELKIFCRTDQQFICPVCLMDEHRGHEAEFQQNVEDIDTKRSSEVKQQIRSQQEDEVNRVLDLQEKLEQEIRDLKSKDREMEQLSHTEDHSQFLHRYPSLSALSESTHSSSFHLSLLRYFEEVTAAVADTRDKLQELLRDKRANLSQKFFSFIHISSFFINLILITFTMEKNFLKYSELTLDPNTAHPRLKLSAANRKATFTLHRNDYHTHPDRFASWIQVLSRESLTGRHYWEVEWTGGAIYVAVTYKNIQTSQYDQAFGSDDKSWALYCDKNSYIFYHKDVQTRLPGPGSSRVRVYLDHGAGVLAFYSVSETMTLLHRTTFTQPLHAGLRFYDYFLYSGGDSAEFVQLNENPDGNGGFGYVQSPSLLPN
uniref:B30.2/SPRY domain-containing protein n=1 Tax=Oryzias latipes TaxID=8090 RepID=A0A3P9IB68_ORYLA